MVNKWSKSPFELLQLITLIQIFSGKTSFRNFSQISRRLVKMETSSWKTGENSNGIVTLKTRYSTYFWSHFWIHENMIKAGRKENYMSAANVVYFDHLLGAALFWVARYCFSELKWDISVTLFPKRTQLKGITKQFPLVYTIVIRFTKNVWSEQKRLRKLLVGRIQSSCWAGSKLDFLRFSIAIWA